MKCDKLKPLVFSLKDFAYIDEPAVEKNFENPHDHAVYKATEVDAAIAELKQKLEDVQASAYADSVDAGMRERRLKRVLWLERAERYKMREFIAREEGNLSCQMSWSQYLRERTFYQWVGQLLRIANLANKLQNKCLAKAEEFGG